MSRPIGDALYNSDESNGLKIEINILPDELIIEIFKLLPLETILECESVCQRWRKLARDAALWRHIPIVYPGKPGMTEVCEKKMEIIKTHSECIHLLKLQYIYNYAIIKSVMEKCHKLISLELVMCRIGKEFETDIMRWPNLKKLNLKNSLLLPGNKEITIQFDQCKYLNYLALSDFGLSSSNCYSLHNCNYLTHILIEKIKDLSLDYIQALILCKRSILVTFHVYGGSAIDDKCLFLLSQCQSLRDLAIIRCENLTDDGLMFLKHLQKIEHLQIWNNSMFSESNLLRTLSSPSLITLQSLSLSRIGNISPIIVDVISEHYKNLKFLALYQCPKIINTDYEKQLKSKFRNIDIVLY